MLMSKPLMITAFICICFLCLCATPANSEGSSNFLPVAAKHKSKVGDTVKRPDELKDGGAGFLPADEPNQVDRLYAKYDLLTFPFDPEKQLLDTDVAEYFGPVEVRVCKDRGKGRGVFLTKDVKAGEILFVERALHVYCTESVKRDPSCTSFLSGFIDDLVQIASTDTRVNSLMSYLVGSAAGKEEEDMPTLALLDINMMRPEESASLPSAPQLSAAQIKSIVNENTLTFRYCRDPPVSMRRSMAHCMKHPIPAEPLSEESQFTYPQPVTPLMKELLSAHLSPESLSPVISSTIQDDMNKADPSGLTALHLAVARGEEHACRALLQAGAMPDVKDATGRTPLHYAVGQILNMDMAKALVDKGACVNAPSKRGLTPICEAVLECQAQAVEWLLQQGAEPYVEDYLFGCTILDHAILHDDVALTAAFKKAGFDLASWKDGLGLWTVASLMSRDARYNTRRKFVGRMLFVTAGCDLQAGTELTCFYSPDEEKFKSVDGA
jgi:hypothetical protein